MDLIEDLNNYVSAWIDWNLVLDESGGPNYAQNTVRNLLKQTNSNKNFIKFRLMLQ